MISDLAPGAIAIGTTGTRCRVVRVEGDYVVIAHSTGYRRVPISRVVRWEPPPTPQVGDRTQLKGTTRAYTVTRIFEHLCGFDNGEPQYETWAECQTEQGVIAKWKLRQLEVIE